MQYVIICGEKTIHTYLLVYVENMSEKTQTNTHTKSGNTGCL